MILIVMVLTGHASLYPLLGRTILAALLICPGADLPEGTDMLCIGVLAARSGGG